MNTEELKRLAEAATPGPWYDRAGVLRGTGGGIKPIATIYNGLNSPYIAAANPAAILAMIAEIDSLRDEVNGLTGTLERVENERNNQILRNHNLMIELRESRRDNAITMGWLADCRTASGDNGDRMLPAFVEYLRDLKQRANK